MNRRFSKKEKEEINALLYRFYFIHGVSMHEVLKNSEYDSNGEFLSSYAKKEEDWFLAFPGYFMFFMQQLKNEIEANENEILLSVYEEQKELLHKKEQSSLMDISVAAILFHNEMNKRGVKYRIPSNINKKQLTKMVNELCVQSSYDYTFLSAVINNNNNSYIPSKQLLKTISYFTETYPNFTCSNRDKIASCLVDTLSKSGGIYRHKCEKLLSKLYSLKQEEEVYEEDYQPKILIFKRRDEDSNKKHLNS